ncbi:hypothetical protein KM1_169680 [Entamoeba histolytica HM-3:IMSS]|uniref:Uncharacterized protein n=2 Tax=Entamoeba histolytica TaxID=5759 RepID=M2QE24_ENTHI|nr:Hypothetical protein EHI5A_132630 [Entamoeba histolytica KU27]EMS11185.1 hypothetical protein KM1_169680 [Entamoeba histolytica HM-3:IMSS]
MMRIEKYQDIGTNLNSVSGLSYISFDCYLGHGQLNVENNYYPQICFVHKNLFYDRVGEIQFPYCGVQLELTGANGQKAICFLSGCYETKYTNGITEDDANRTILTSRSLYELLSWNIFESTFIPVIMSPYPVKTLPVQLVVLQRENGCSNIIPVYNTEVLIYMTWNTTTINININGTFTVCLDSVNRLNLVTLSDTKFTFYQPNLTQIGKLQSSVPNAFVSPSPSVDFQWFPTEKVFPEDSSNSYDQKYQWKRFFLEDRMEVLNNLPLYFSPTTFIGYKMASPFNFHKVFKSYTSLLVVNSGYKFLRGGLVIISPSYSLNFACQLHSFNITELPFTTSDCTSKTKDCNKCGGSIDCVFIRLVVFIGNTRCSKTNNAIYYKFESGSIIVDILQVILDVQNKTNSESFCDTKNYFCNGKECTPPYQLLNSGHVNCTHLCGYCRSGFSCNEQGKCIQNTKEMYQAKNMEL